jgi:hypothetical protein
LVQPPTKWQQYAAATEKEEVGDGGEFNRKETEKETDFRKRTCERKTLQKI